MCVFVCVCVCVLTRHDKVKGSETLAAECCNYNFQRRWEVCGLNNAVVSLVKNQIRR